VPHLPRANATNLDTKRTSGVTGCSFCREARAVLVAAAVLRDDVLYGYPFALESAGGSVVALETCCPAGSRHVFISCLWWESAIWVGPNLEWE